MTSFHPTFNLVVALFLAVYLLETAAELLNLKTSRLPLPASLRDLQTPADQEKASLYLRDRVRLSVLKNTYFFALFWTLIQFHFFSRLQGFSLEMTSSPILQSFLFVAVLVVGQALLNLPFSIFSTFRIEELHQFNRTTPQTFISDFFKGALIATVLGGFIFWFLLQALSVFGDQAWFWMWVGYTLFQCLLVWIAPVTLLPLFLKLTPLKEGPLKNEIEAYSQKLNFELNGVWVCDASKRSAKSNAFFTGFGRFRRLVLFDTLIEKHSTAEIVSIVAHEAGHFKLGHIWKGTLLSAFSSLVVFYLIQQFIKNDFLYSNFEMRHLNDGIGMILAGLVINKILFFTAPLSSFFSRKNEYAADRFSAKTTGTTQPLIQGLKRLVTDNLGTLQHHPLYVILNDSHPPLPDRIKALDSIT